LKIARIAIAIKIARSAIVIRIARTIVAKKFEKYLDQEHKNNFLNIFLDITTTTTTTTTTTIEKMQIIFTNYVYTNN